MKRIAASWFLAIGLLLPTQSAWAEAGRVMFVSGQASVIRGSSLPIDKNMVVEPGDTIVTGADGRVHLLMADGDRIALRPDSRFSIDEFSGPSRTKPDEPVPDARPSSWKSFYSLAKGGFRTLTRSQGERDLSSYQVRTPVATMGIRGTDYTLLLVPPLTGNPGNPHHSSEEVEEALEMYLAVWHGAVVMRNDSGEFIIHKNQFVLIKNSSSPPQFLSSLQGVLMDMVYGDGEGDWDNQINFPISGVDAQGNPIGLTSGNVKNQPNSPGNSGGGGNDGSGGAGGSAGGGGSPPGSGGSGPPGSGGSPGNDGPPGSGGSGPPGSGGSPGNDNPPGSGGSGPPGSGGSPGNDNPPGSGGSGPPGSGGSPGNDNPPGSGGSGPPNGPPDGNPNGPPNGGGNGPPNGPPDGLPNGPPESHPNGPPDGNPNGPPNGGGNGPPNGPPEGKGPPEIGDCCSFST